jgi:AhpD family alkylhydroperoxidase
VRLDHVKELPAVYRFLREAPAVFEGTGIDAALRDLAYVRASQLNGCSFCLDMHWRDARARGETEARLALVAAWREAACFTERERAALAWTEAVTLVADTHVPDAVYEQAAAHFPPSDLVALTFAVTVINSWNRLQVAFRVPPRDPGP